MGQLIELVVRKNSHRLPKATSGMSLCKTLPVYQQQQDSSNQDTIGIWVIVGRGKDNCLTKQMDEEEKSGSCLAEYWTFLLCLNRCRQIGILDGDPDKGVERSILVCGPLCFCKTKSRSLHKDTKVKFSVKKVAMICIVTFNLAKGMRYRRSLRDGGKVWGSNGQLQSCVHLCLAHLTMECWSNFPLGRAWVLV